MVLIIIHNYKIVTILVLLEEFLTGVKTSAKQVAVVQKSHG